MGENIVSDEAWVTLATTNQYALGALVLGHSLKRVGTTRQLVVMVTPGVTEPMRNELVKVFNDVVSVDVMDSRDVVNLALIERPDLGVTFTKLHCWRLTKYKKCVFMDADTLVIQNSDELFERPELSAAPDIGWPDNFNTGVFVFVPSEQTYELLLAFALQHGSFDGGDQGLLNAYFSDWYMKDISFRLPFAYNCSASAFYTYKAAFKRYLSDVKIVHFLGVLKPWHYTYESGSGKVLWRTDGGHSIDHLQLWWDVCAAYVIPQLAGGELPPFINGQTLFSHIADDEVEAASLASQVQQVTINPTITEEDRRRAWEQGRPDVGNTDSFAAIQRHMEEQIGGGQS